MEDIGEKLPKARRWPWLKLTLIVSLGANLLILGVVLGAMSSQHGPHREKRAPRDSSFMYLDALQPKERRAIRKRLITAFRSEAASPGTSAMAFRAALAALAEEPFDETAFDAALSRQSQAGIDRLRITQRELVSHVAGMGVNERAAYASRLRELRKRGKADRRRDK